MKNTWMSVILLVVLSAVCCLLNIFIDNVFVLLCVNFVFAIIILGIVVFIIKALFKSSKEETNVENEKAVKVFRKLFFITITSIVVIVAIFSALLILI